MTRIRRHAGICCLAGVAVLLWAREGGAQEKPAGPAAALSAGEQQDAAMLSAAVDTFSAGKWPADDALSWLGHHFFRSQGDSIYIPFTVGVDKRLLTGATVAVYVRAVNRAAGRSSKPAWEGTYSIDAPPDARIARAIALPAGTYDVYVAIKGKNTASAAARTAITQHELVVPSLAGPGLMTSSIILASALEQLPAPLPQDKQEENPYVFGPHKLTPSADRVFPRSSELHLWFMIYGASETDGKPDVQVDLSFHHRLPEGDKYFNRTLPQELNEKTLAPEFNLSMGHQLISRFSVALGTFQPGDYRLEIKVTDRPSGRSLTSNVDFAVSAS